MKGLLDTKVSIQMPRKLWENVLLKEIHFVTLGRPWEKRPMSVLPVSLPVTLLLLPQICKSLTESQCCKTTSERKFKIRLNILVWLDNFPTLEVSGHGTHATLNTQYTCVHITSQDGRWLSGWMSESSVYGALCNFKFRKAQSIFIESQRNFSLKSYPTLINFLSLVWFHMSEFALNLLA